MTDDDPEVLAVRKRHPNIPQDELPADWPTEEQGGGRSVRTKYVPAKRYVDCPGCSRQSVGVIPGENDTEVIREHHYRTYGDVTLQCRASGTEAPRHRPRSTLSLSTAQQ